jgi:predicted nucleic acid-binding protein
MTLVDTNVILDILTNDPTWAEWSIVALRRRTEHGPVLINEVVYAELAGQMLGEAQLNETLRALQVRLERTPQSALFLAATVFRRYRRGGGVRTGVLPDFFIGANAEVARLPLLTRDIGRYRTYFPKITLIAPDS